MRVLVLGALVMMLGGCGPTADEIAATSLTATPFAFGFAVLALWGLQALWRDRLGKTKAPSEALATTGMIFAGLAMIAASSSDFDDDMFPACVVMISGVAIALTMLAGRIRLGGDPRRALFAIPATVVALVEAPFLIGWIGEGPLEDLAVSGGVTFVLAVGMYASTPLILGLLVETVWARRRYQREHAIEDQPPTGDLEDEPWMVEERMYEQRLYNRRW